MPKLSQGPPAYEVIMRELCLVPNNCPQYIYIYTYILANFTAVSYRTAVGTSTVGTLVSTSKYLPQYGTKYRR